MPSVITSDPEGYETVHDWYRPLTPSNAVLTFEPEAGIEIRATRIENEETGKAESYILEIVTEKGKEYPVKVNFADGYEMTMYCDADSDGMDTGVMIIDGVYKTTRYTMSEPVELLRTDETGTAVSENLPLGRYVVRELEAPEGYVLNPEEFYISLEYKDQTVPLVSENIESTNRKVVTEIEVLKVYETGYQTGDFRPGVGATFGLYDGTDGRLLYRIQPDAEGIIKAEAELEADRIYYIKEISAPSGYVLCDMPFYFAVSDAVKQEKTDFRFFGDGISGEVFMNRSGQAQLNIRTLARYPDEQLFSGSDMISEKIVIEDGNSKTVMLANGKKISASVRGNVFDYDFAGITGTYTPQVVYTGYYAEAKHIWNVPEYTEGTAPETVTDTLILEGAEGIDETVTICVTHIPEQGEYIHTASVDGNELKAGEDITLTTISGQKIYVMLDDAGTVYACASGIVKGAIREEQIHRAYINGELMGDGFRCSKSVSFARQSSEAQTIQVKINSYDNINAGIIRNEKQDSGTSPDIIVPFIPGVVPDIPDVPKKPVPEEIKQQEPELPEAAEIPERAEVPKTGRGSSLPWVVLAMMSALCMLIMVGKKYCR